MQARPPQAVSLTGCSSGLGSASRQRLEVRGFDFTLRTMLPAPGRF